MAVYTEGTDEEVEEKEDSLRNLKRTSIETFKAIARTTLHQPPPRFTEAMLVKTLEENGIGRLHLCTYNRYHPKKRLCGRKP